MLPMQHDVNPVNSNSTTTSLHDGPAASHGAGLTYGAVFAALCVLTVVSVAADALPLGGLGLLVLVVALIVAVLKARLVMLYFMHLKHERGWKYVILMPTAMLAAGLPLLMAGDLALHYYPLDRALTSAGAMGSAVTSAPPANMATPAADAVPPQPGGATPPQ